MPIEYRLEVLRGLFIISITIKTTRYVRRTTRQYACNNNNSLILYYYYTQVHTEKIFFIFTLATTNTFLLKER